MDLSSYATKDNLKGATGIDTSTLTSKLDLDSLQSKIDNLDEGNLKTSLVDLSKLSNVVDNDVVKNIMYDKLVTKPTPFILRHQILADKSLK